MIDKLLKEKENIQKQQNKQNKRLKAIEEKLQQLEEEARRNWTPALGDEYYFITDDGSIGRRQYSNCTIDQCRIDLGNCFETTFIAEFERERLYILTQLKRFSCKFSSEDWHRSSAKYSLVYDSYNDKIYIKENTFLKTGSMYFKDEKDASLAIKSIGPEKIIKYYLRAGEQSE